jgi:FtsZ-binding cell division protein ZapB
MISEFQDLSDKIDRLAQLTQSLRAENQLLRKANSLLGAENIAFKHRLREAQARVEALLEKFPAPAAEAADEQGSEAGEAVPDIRDEEASR